MGNRIWFACLLCAVAVGAHCEEGPKGFKFQRSTMSLSAGLTFDGGSDAGFSYMMMTSSFIGDSPFCWGFNSVSGKLGPDIFFESGAQAGIGGPLLGRSLGGEARLGLDFGGRVDASSLRYESEAPAVLLGLALSFPYAEDWGLGLHFDAFVRPYDLTASRWDFRGSYCSLYLSLGLKRRMEARPTKWSEGLKAD